MARTELKNTILTPEVIFKKQKIQFNSIYITQSFSLDLPKHFYRGLENLK